MSWAEIKQRFWNVFGNDGTDPVEEFCGTSDDTDFRLATNSVTDLRFDSTNKSMQATDDGDARGIRARDFQRVRSTSDQVASGSDSAIIHGTNNKNDDQNSAIIGGTGNTHNSGNGNNFIANGSGNQTSNSGSANFAFVGNGSNNAVVAGGAHSILNGQNNAVGGTFFNSITNGFGCTINGTQLNSIVNGSACTITGSAIAGLIGNGVNHSVDGILNTVVNGSINTINSGAVACSILNGGNNIINSGVFGGTILQGFGSTLTDAFQTYLNGIIQASRPMEVVHSGGNFGLASSAYCGLQGQIATTTSATGVELAATPLIAGAQTFTMPQDHSCNVEVNVVARSTGGVDNAGWTFTAGIKDVGGVVTLVSAAGAVAPIWSDTAAAGAWTITPAASAAPNRLSLTVVGTAATTVRWCAQLKYTEVEFP